jgi:gliding motility-associated lipoprotein GldH
MNKIKKIAGLVAVIFASFFLKSCETKLFYSESIAIDSSGWLKSDTLIFSPQLENIEARYNIYLWVRHSKDYTNSNLWLKVISVPNMTTDSTYLVDIPIADKTGKWLGECSTSLCTQRILLNENFQFTDLGAFKVEVLHYMRADDLQEVKNIGLEFEMVK